MARLLGFLFLLILAVTGLSFAVLNAAPVPLNYYFGQREIPLALIIVVALATGALLGVLASLPLILRLRRRLAGLQRQQRKSSAEAGQAHALPPGA